MVIGVIVLKSADASPSKRGAFMGRGTGGVR